MKSPVCIDASLILQTLVPDVYSEAAEMLLAYWQKSATPLIAPALLTYEVTASLRRMVYLNAVRPERGEAALAVFLRLPIRVFHRKSIFPLAWALAQQFNQPRAYDTAYLALAQLNDCDFWTADKKLYNVVQNKLTWVKWVGNTSSA